MAIQKTEAVILRTAKFRETSLITTFFTEDFGRIKGLSKGVRKEGSLLLPNYELFNQVQIVFYEKMKSEIHLVSEASLVYHFPRLRRDLAKIAWASFLMELVDTAQPLHEKSEWMFQLLLSVLHLVEDQSAERPVCFFIVRLLCDSGLFPRLDACTKCGRAAEKGVLGFEEGGLVCDDCAGLVREGSFLPREVAKSIAFFAGNEMGKCLSRAMTKETERAVLETLYRWVRYRFEKEFATMRFLWSSQILQST